MKAISEGEVGVAKDVSTEAGMTSTNEEAKVGEDTIETSKDV